MKLRFCPVGMLVFEREFGMLDRFLPVLSLQFARSLLQLFQLR